MIQSFLKQCFGHLTNRPKSLRHIGKGFWHYLQIFLPERSMKKLAEKQNSMCKSKKRLRLQFCVCGWVGACVHTKDCKKTFFLFHSYTRSMKHSGFYYPASCISTERIYFSFDRRERNHYYMISDFSYVKNSTSRKAVRMSCINYLTLAGKIILSVIWPLVSCCFW